MTDDEKKRRAAERTAEWRRNNPGRYAEYLKDYYRSNKAAISAQKKVYCEAHREELAAARKAKYVPHPKPPKKTPAERSAIKKAYRLRTLEATLARDKAYREANKAKCYATTVAWKKANRARWYEHGKRWLDKKPGYRSKIAAKRRADQLRATPSWADSDAVAQFYVDAVAKTQETGIKHEVDHIYPLRGKTVCGLHVEHNLRIVTRHVNRTKHNKHPDELVAEAA